jgi:hypothetical protein
MPAELLSANSLTYSNRVMPWHKMGIPMTEQLTAVEALVKTNLDYRVDKALPVVLLSNGEFLEVEQYCVLVRDPIPMHGRPNHEPIGTCSIQYELLQNRDICEILDASGITKKWPVDTLGALGKGDRFFVTLNAGKWSIAGEEMVSFVSALDDKKGSAGLRLVVTDFAVVCTNTYQGADASAKISASIPHNSKIKANFEWKAQLFHSLQEHQRSFKEVAEHFAHRKVTAAEVSQLIETVYPLPKVPAAVTEAVRIAAEVDERDKLTNQVAVELLGATTKQVGRVGGDPLAKFNRDKLRVLHLRDNVEREFELTNAERPKIRGTAWALFNAFTGAIDHAPRGGANSNVATRAESVTIGDDAKLKMVAFNAIADLSRN